MHTIRLLNLIFLYCLSKKHIIIRLSIDRQIGEPLLINRPPRENIMQEVVPEESEN